MLTSSNLDMVIGRRVHEDQAAYRHGHVLGNRMMTGFLGMLFGAHFSDIFSGYRVFSRRFPVGSSFPVLLVEAWRFSTELGARASPGAADGGSTRATPRARPAPPGAS